MSNREADLLTDSKSACRWHDPSERGRRFVCSGILSVSQPCDPSATGPALPLGAPVRRMDGDATCRAFGISASSTIVGSHHSFTTPVSILLGGSCQSEPVIEKTRQGSVKMALIIMPFISAAAAVLVAGLLTSKSGERPGASTQLKA